MQVMKKSLLFVAVAVMILNATGCGACRNGLFRNQTAAAPMVGHVQQCAPVCQAMCQPMCCPPPCDPCCSGGTAVSAGFDSGAMMMGPTMGAGCACGQ
jgi:hypothetical protein